ncbi:MAG: hypothetical protein GY816_10425 [Cytophagales bacterium]|nr:hypothetical protein [Cytophagales bacterium]
MNACVFIRVFFELTSRAIIDLFNDAVISANSTCSGHSSFLGLKRYEYQDFDSTIPINTIFC